MTGPRIAASSASSAVLAAVSCAVVVMVGVVIFDVSTAAHDSPRVVLVELQRDRGYATVHFVLVDGLAPLLFCLAAARAIRRTTPVDAAFSAALSASAAMLISLIQLTVNLWLTLNGRPDPDAASVAIATVDDLGAARFALLAVVFASLVRLTRGTPPTPRDVLLMTTASALALDIGATVIGSSTTEWTGWLAVPLALISLCVVAAGRGSSQ